MSGLRPKGSREAGNPTFVFSSLTFLGGPTVPPPRPGIGGSNSQLSPGGLTRLQVLVLPPLGFETSGKWLSPSEPHLTHPRAEEPASCFSGRLREITSCKVGSLNRER